MTTEQPNLRGALARIHVNDLDAAVPLYRELADGEDAHVFRFRDLRLARIGPFLLIEGADDEVRSHAATIVVGDIDLVASTVSAAGGELIDGPSPAPSGPRLVARHPDGSVIEYIQPVRVVAERGDAPGS